jgi:hypothetical protein
MPHHREALRRFRSPEKPRPARSEVLESGVVPSRTHDVLSPALTLHSPRDNVIGFGASIAGTGDFLLASGRLEDRHPFAALYRLTPDGAVREQLLRGSASHLGPTLATDGSRVVVGQPSADGGLGFVSVYKNRVRELEFETTIEGQPGSSWAQRWGERVAISNDLLVLGQAASVSVYRHSPVGWLSAGSLTPNHPYSWNPGFGRSLGVVRGRVLVGNPIELSGHRAGPGRVYIYRPEGDHMALEGLLRGDGIEFGREEQPHAGFGATMHVSGDHVLIGAPHEQLQGGKTKSRVYVYRARKHGALDRLACVDVPNCDGGAVLIGDRMIVLGDALRVWIRRGRRFEPSANYPIEASQGASLAVCGNLLALGRPNIDTGEISLYFVDQL